MNVASLELCKELYELSGWTGCNFHHSTDDDQYYLTYMVGSEGDKYPLNRSIEKRKFIIDLPAYDLGYMLRKLPAHELHSYNNGVYAAIHKGLETFNYKASTPEDAAAKLAIQLFKQNILTSEGDE